jgi:drug/metabolite transporter (DMT)-like permease
LNSLELLNSLASLSLELSLELLNSLESLSLELSLELSLCLASARGLPTFSLESSFVFSSRGHLPPYACW